MSGKRVFIFSLFILLALLCFGQSIRLPYYCGFEDSVENQKWILNYNPNLPPGRLKNLWHLGGAVSSEGSKSLYVSSDGGHTASYTNTDNTILAYRVFDLPAGVYDLAFDWMAYADASSAIHVAWIDSSLNKVLSLTTPDLPLVIKQHELSMSNGETLNGVAVWKRAMTQINVEAGKKYKLVFAWNNTTVAFINPGGCIDNIEITKASCVKPYNLQVLRNKSDISVLWDGEADEYQLAYKKFDTNTWTYNIIKGKKQWSIYDLSNGVYDIRVRSICGPDTSLWVFLEKQLVYEALCIDYVDIASAECVSGSVSELNAGKGVVGPPIDYGSDNIRSRHTVHFLPGERDPRTKNLLKTVPDGEVASVRVGTWDNAHAESITYRYTVDTTVARVMMLKYAIVFEDPNHPNITDQPHFLLQIFDENDVQLNPDCAEANFYAKSGIDGWTSLVYGGRNLVWKDWTTLGINLGSLHGLNIKIKVSVFGCAFSAHYAYGYFTLSCSAGKLEGINCGDTPTTEFIAPEGFHYRWYEKGKKNVILSDSSVFDVAPDDTQDYCVDVMYPENHDCYFTLLANATPRFPKAKAEYNVEFNDCRSYVRCVSKSYIETKFGISPDKVESLQWYCDDIFISGADSLKYQLPNDGQVHTVKLIAGLCDDLCTDTFTFEVFSPQLESSVFEYTEVLCVPFDSLNINKPDKVDSLTSKFGCDSVVITHYQLVSSKDTIIYAEICSDSTFQFNGKEIIKSGIYYDTILSQAGCDSIIELHVTVHDVLSAKVPEQIVVCADDMSFSIPVNLLSGNVDSVSLDFSNDTISSRLSLLYSDDDIEVELVKHLPPGIYEIKLSLINYFCGNLILPIRIVVYYPASIVAQKWNDVLAVLNSSYNGGHEFIGFQWYKNEVPIEGETGSYYYTNGVDFSITDTFYVMLTRTDGLTLPTCNIGVTSHVDDSEYNSLVNSFKVGQKICFNNADPCEAYIYSVSGFVVGVYKLNAYSEINVPDIPGMYIVVCKQKSTVDLFKILVSGS